MLLVLLRLHYQKHRKVQLKTLNSTNLQNSDDQGSTQT